MKSAAAMVVAMSIGSAALIASAASSGGGNYFDPPGPNNRVFGSNIPAGRYEGHLDRIATAKLSGWVLDCTTVAGVPNSGKLFISDVGIAKPLADALDAATSQANDGDSTVFVGENGSVTGAGSGTEVPTPRQGQD